MLAFIFLLAFGVSSQDTLQKYFFENRTDKCWVQDRQNNKEVISVAATGFGFAAWSIAAQEGKISREQASQWINTGFDETIKVNRKNFGWLYHFTNREGQPVIDTEVSSIDTVIFYLSAENAAMRLHDHALLDKIHRHKSLIDLKFMMRGTKYFSHGFRWVNGKPVFLNFDWKCYSEGALIYKYFNIPYKPTAISYDLPLFVYYYPLCFYPNDKEMIEHLGKAIKYQTKKTGKFGFTSCDGPKGYIVLDYNLISPLAIWSCLIYYPDECRELLIKLHLPHHTPSMILGEEWVNKDRIGIDDGACLLLTNSGR
jgi:hypothetical protein